MAESPVETKPDTIVLIHGFWVTPRSWEHWKKYYEAKRYTVLIPAPPGVRGRGRGSLCGSHADRAAPGAGNHRDAREINREIGSSADHHRAFGWRRVHPDLARSRLRCGWCGDRLRADRGREGHSALRDQVRVPNPEEPREPASSGRLHAETVARRFTNTFSEEKSLELYERYHIPASGRVFWGSALANIQPGKDETYVDYKNDARPPLLFISGKQDHLFPPKVGPECEALQVQDGDGDRGVRWPASAARHRWMEEVADFALDWALKHAG